ncbi:uncharacterized protein LOC100677797 isoform X1 [Nasonia vitripennis]|uniref:Mab-21-like nucleotidyltransferase domain-containing protein n=1 Tax=Nasonia vitripennis TaxID=7425 RepID=A0A7M7QRG6_NASVI|nr:uncharacterized protein LOC100677797 isoform X1 [Nasonia vitripennis]XP_032451744.1 uncharacterized protein LOC100677797 isoform X1 [Nasonia vitripennis]
MQEDALFKDTYRNINYACSFFKGTKVGKPDEYDLDLRMRLPLNYPTLKVKQNHENYGYVKVKVEDDSKVIVRLPKWKTHSKILNEWLDNKGYLDKNKFRQWMEKVMSKTYDRLIKVDKDYELTVEDKTYVLKQYKKSGPAFTIYVQPKDESEADHIMNVDLVPCLEFEDITLDGYKQISYMTNNIIIVAKPSNEPDGHRL